MTQSISTHPKPDIAVDLTILTVRDGALCCVLMRRDDAVKVGGQWALPGGFVRLGDSLEDTVSRVMEAKIGIAPVRFEQLASYGALNRDPRGQVISIVYLALCPSGPLLKELARKPELTLATLHVDWPGEQGGKAHAYDGGNALGLAFDHADILGDVVKRLRGKLDYSPIGYGFLPPEFTLRDVQEVHEAILGHPLTKPAFRRKLLDRGMIEATGKKETGGAFRPAELYQVKE